MRENFIDSTSKFTKPTELDDTLDNYDLVRKAPKKSFHRGYRSKNTAYKKPK